MNQKALWVIITLVAVLIVAGWIFVWRVPAANNVFDENTEKVLVVKTGVQHRIRMKNNDFVPKELGINKGDEVIFENEDGDEHWPASDVHPTHLLCPGFDAQAPLKKGEAYTHIFDASGNCPMHDHVMPFMRGKIIVK